MSSSQCFENPPSKNAAYGAGTVQELGGLTAYLTGPPDSKLAILLISDVFGYEVPNLRYGWITGLIITTTILVFHCMMD